MADLWKIVQELMYNNMNNSATAPLIEGTANMAKFPGQYVQDYQPGQTVDPAATDWASQMGLSMVGSPGVPSQALGSASAPLGRNIAGKVFPEKTFPNAKPLDNWMSRYPNDRPSPESLLNVGVNRDAGSLQGYRYYAPYYDPLPESKIGGRYKP